ncbi:hypothetical protein FRC07_007649, partial [Ceratobasidium sp. 392]
MRSVYAEGGGTLVGGLRSLWRGTAATVTRGAVITTAQIGSYDHFKQEVKNRGLMEEGVSLHLASSLFAGLVCSVASNPVDVIKVRLMNDRARAYNGILDCILKTTHNEGPLAFYKGFGMCWIRLGSHTTLTLLLFALVAILLCARGIVLQISAMAVSDSGSKLTPLPNEFYEPYLSELANSRRPNPIRGLYPLEARPGMISMLAGKPNAETFPFTSFSFTANDPTHHKDILAANEPPSSIVAHPNAPDQLHITVSPAQLAAALQYGPTTGIPDLISWVFTLQAVQHGRHKGEGWRVTIGAGSQDLLYKSFSAFINPGDPILVEAPAYAGVVPMLKSSLCELVEVPTDGQGIQSFKLKHILDSWPQDKPKPKILYTTPYGSNPSGATATTERRKQVLELAREHKFVKPRHHYLSSDDPYFYLYFGEQPRPPSYFHLEAQDGGPVGMVLRYDSLSKILSA